MKNKLIFRIIGALASALIIVSVFVPFVSVTGYTTSLWESFSITNSQYLPIMIVIFGVIGVIFFSLNVKTEFAYMSTGAITFFVVMQTIDILNQGVFNTLGIGYYLLCLGALLTGVMAFLTNLKSNKKIKEVSTDVPVNEPRVLDQIDKLYNDQTMTQDEISPIQPIDNVVDPIPIQPVYNVEEQLQKNIVTEEVSVEPQVIPTPSVQSVEPIKQEPLVEKVQESVQINNPQVELQPVNPVLQQFIQPENTVVQNISTPEVTPKPTVEEQPIMKPEISPEPINTNPVLNEFINPRSNIEPQKSNDLDIFNQ